MNSDTFDKKAQQFRDEAKQYNLIYDCRGCVHLDTDSQTCSMVYPNDMIWRAAATGSPYDDGRLIFCKYFEHR